MSSELENAGAGQGPRAWGARLGTLALFVAAWFAINGYSFGIFDQAIHLAYLLKELDPSLLRTDPLMKAAANHPSLLWVIQALLVRVVPVEPLYLGLHVLSVAAMLAGTAALTRALYPGPHREWAATLAMVAVLISRTTIADIPTMDELVLNRTLSLGPLLFALALGAQRRYAAAFLLTGLVFLIHPTTAVHAALLLWTATLLDKEHRKAAVSGPLLCALTASPLLVLMLWRRTTQGVPFPPPDEWIHLTRLHVIHHYPSTWELGLWLTAVPPLLVLAAALRAQRSRPVEHYLLGIAATCLVGALGTEVLHLPTALHLHLQESTRFLDFLAAACGAHWVLRSWPSRDSGRWLPGLAAVLAMLGLTTVQLPLVVLGALPALFLPRAPASPARPPPRWLPVTVGLALVPIALGFRFFVMHVPPRYTYRIEQQQGGRMMSWARAHLPIDALVVLPPFFGEVDVAFRYGAQRSSFGMFKDGAEGSFNAAFMHDWKQRTEALCGCRSLDLLAEPLQPGEEYVNQFRRVRREIRAGYREADTARFRELAARYGATHAVVETEASEELELPLEYEDEEYKLYRLVP